MRGRGSLSREARHTRTLLAAGVWDFLIARTLGRAHLQHPSNVRLMLSEEGQALRKIRGGVEARRALEDGNEVLADLLGCRSDLPAGPPQRHKGRKIQLRQDEMLNVGGSEDGRIGHPLQRSGPALLGASCPVSGHNDIMR